MNSTYFPISSAADSLITPGAPRARVLAAALAWAVAQMQALPAERPESVQDYYDANVERAVRVTLGELNEAMVFDLRSALVIAKGLWRVRLSAAYPVMLVAQSNSFFESAFDVLTCMSDENVDLLNAHADAVVRLARVAVEALQTSILARSDIEDTPREGLGA